MSADPGSDLGVDPHIERTREAGRSAAQVLKESAVAGLTVLVPIFITLLVFQAIAGYVVSVLELPVQLFESLGLTPQESQLVVRVFVAVVLGLTVVGVGFLTRFRYGERAIERVDAVISSVPGFGAVYKSFREMGDVMLESDAKNFRDVKLVEFPADDSYTMGFLTTQTPEELQEAAGRSDMVTLFLPLAPNPVMGGHLVHVPEERVMDVDMTVEEGIRTVVTSGVATASPEGADGLSRERLRQVSDFTGASSGGVGGTIDNERGRSQEMDADREREYERYAVGDPREADDPETVERVRETDTLGEPGRPRSSGDGEPVSDGDPAPHPEDVTDGDGILGDDADSPDDVVRDHDDTLGEDVEEPRSVTREDDAVLGDDADRPEAVGPDGEGSVESRDRRGTRDETEDGDSNADG